MLPPLIVASPLPAMTVKTVRASLPIAFITPFANVSDAVREHEVATPTPGAAAADVGDARRDEEHKRRVDTGGGSVTLMLAPPVGALIVQAPAEGDMFTTSAVADEKESAPTGTARL